MSDESIITVYRRIKDAYFINSTELFYERLRKAKGISPEFCPAIKDSLTRGVFVSPPFDFPFYGNRSFLIKKFCCKKNKKKLLLSPGVIGKPDDRNLFARIDTGFSFSDLNVEVLAIKSQTSDWSYKKVFIPPCVYPVGYSGPILIPVCSGEEITITRKAPLLQLIPLSGSMSVSLQFVDAFSLQHPGFEGLYYENWVNEYRLIDECRSELFSWT